MRFVLALCFLATAVLADDDSADTTIKVKISIPDIKQQWDTGVDKIKEKWNSKDEDLKALKENVAAKKDALTAKWDNRSEELKELKIKVSSLDLDDVKAKIPTVDDLQNLKEKASLKIEAAKEKLPNMEDLSELKEKIDTKAQAIKNSLPDMQDLTELKEKISDKTDDVKGSLSGVGSKLKSLKNKLNLTSINAEVTVDA